MRGAASRAAPLGNLKRKKVLLLLLLLAGLRGVRGLSRATSAVQRRLVEIPDLVTAPRGDEVLSRLALLGLLHLQLRNRGLEVSQVQTREGGIRHRNGQALAVRSSERRAAQHSGQDDGRVGRRSEPCVQNDGLGATRGHA